MYSEVRIPHINENRGVCMFKKVELQEGVTLYIRQSDQFKTVNFSVKWKTALDEKNQHNAPFWLMFYKILMVVTERKLHFEIR